MSGPADEASAGQRSSTWARPTQPLDAALVEALAERYDLSGRLGVALEEGWPAPVILGQWHLFAPPAELLRRRGEVEGWPAEWLPVGGDGGHLVWFLRADAPGLWAIFDDQPPPFFPRLSPEWPDERRFFEIVAAAERALTEEPFDSAGGLTWLRPPALEQLRAAVGNEEEVARILAMLQLETRDSVRAQWESDAHAAAIAGGFTTLMTLGCLAFLLVPTDNMAGMATLVLWIATLPGGLTAYLWWSWRAARRRIEGLDPS